MKSDQQLVIERPESRSIQRGPETSTVKTILLHIIDDEFHDHQIDTALSLARAHSAHLSCLHVTPIEAYVAFDSFGGVFVMKTSSGSSTNATLSCAKKLKHGSARRTSAGTMSKQPATLRP